VSTGSGERGSKTPRMVKRMLSASGEALALSIA
jgi:hypothetical protein